MDSRLSLTSKTRLVTPQHPRCTGTQRYRVSASVLDALIVLRQPRRSSAPIHDPNAYLFRRPSTAGTDGLVSAPRFQILTYQTQGGEGGSKTPTHVRVGSATLPAKPRHAVSDVPGVLTLPSCALIRVYSVKKPYDREVLRRSPESLGRKRKISRRNRAGPRRTVPSATVNMSDTEPSSQI